MFAAGTGNDHGRGDVVAAVHTPDGLRVTAIVGALIGAGVTFGALVLAIKLLSHRGLGTQAIVTCFMGHIVALMGMQFVWKA
jgi:small neutral amino acid transporter SnatA (MarC family)